MRQFRTSGVTRGERVAGHGMRAVSHVRGNPETDVYRSLNIGYQLSYSTVFRGLMLAWRGGLGAMAKTKGVNPSARRQRGFFEARLKLIKRLEEMRGSSVFCYLTSLRPNVMAAMAEDSVRVLLDHVAMLPARPVEKLDVFLCSNGGSGAVPWRMVSLFREFANSFNVLIPYRAYGAASLLALGADGIVMHPFAELGPIDPTVANDFNPVRAGPAAWHQCGRRDGLRQLHQGHGGHYP